MIWGKGEHRIALKNGTEGSNWKECTHEHRIQAINSQNSSNPVVLNICDP